MAREKTEQTFKDQHFPAEMRRQLWPLCCGASILSGFKDVQKMTEDELQKAILSTIKDQIPDFQVFVGEQMRPKLTFLTLNHEQAHSKKIMTAIEAVGFRLIGTARPRNLTQSFFVRDESNSWAAA